MIDFEKFVKYSKPGPRYTSYPTALEFSENFSYNDYLARLENAPKNRPLSLYFHLPFCRSACYFCGCNVIYTSKEENLERYADYLCREMEILARHLDCTRVVEQLHFGGGTPTFFNAALLRKIIAKIRATFANFSPTAEISCEIDPRFLTEEQMEVLTAGGFNRVSFGVQDFDEQVQKQIHRIQPFEVTQNAVQLARKYGVKSINCDLIYGLVAQTTQTFEKTLETALKLGVDRFAVFNYAHVPWIKKSMRKFDEALLPSPKSKLEMLKMTMDFFTSNGYEMIGMDHYAKPQDELFAALKNGSLHRNFQGYTTKGGADLIGVGLTSIGEGEDYYAQNFKELKEYENAIDNGVLPNFKGLFLTKEDRLRKAVIMSLMANFSLDISKIEAEFETNFFTHFAKELESLKSLEEFVEVSEKKIKVTPTGTLLIRNIAMCFDEYMQKFIGQTQSFSKTI